MTPKIIRAMKMIYIKGYPYFIGIIVVCFVCYAIKISNEYKTMLTAVPLWMIIGAAALQSLAVAAVLTVIYIIVRKRSDGIINIYKLRKKAT